MKKGITFYIKKESEETTFYALKEMGIDFEIQGYYGATDDSCPDSEVTIFGVDQPKKQAYSKQLKYELDGIKKKVNENEKSLNFLQQLENLRYNE